MTTTAPTIISIEPFGPACGWSSINRDELAYWDRQYLDQLRDSRNELGDLYIIHYDDGTWADATSSELYVDDLAATIAPFVAAPTETGPWQFCDMKLGPHEGHAHWTPLVAPALVETEWATVKSDGQQQNPMQSDVGNDKI